MPKTVKEKHLLVNTILMGNPKVQLGISCQMEAFMRETGEKEREMALGFNILIR